MVTTNLRPIEASHDEQQRGRSEKRRDNRTEALSLLTCVKHPAKKPAAQIGAGNPCRDVANKVLSASCAFEYANNPPNQNAHDK